MASTGADRETICLRIGDETPLIVSSGIGRLDNRKVKDVWAARDEYSIERRFSSSPATPLAAFVRFDFYRRFRSTAIFRCGASKRLCPRPARAMQRLE